MCYSTRPGYFHKKAADILGRRNNNQEDWQNDTFNKLHNDSLKELADIGELTDD